MQNPALLVIRFVKACRVKIGKVKALWGCLGHPACQMENLYTFGAPFTSGILACRHADLLSGAETLRVAFTMLAGWNFLPKDDDGVQNLYATQHAVAALYKDPAVNRGCIDWRINDPAAKSTIGGGDWKGGGQQPEREGQHAHLHTNSDAKLPGGVLR